MSRKQYSKELKLELVKKHLEDGISYWKLGKEYGIEASIIRRWGHKHETFGEDGLEKQNADLCNYSAEFKKKIVLEFNTFLIYVLLSTAITINQIRFSLLTTH